MNINLQNWMKEIDGNAKLFSINIPGTHDSATKYAQFSHFSKCQDESIFNQLKLGIRALDIRVKSNGDRLQLVHGIANTFAFGGANASKLMMNYVLERCYEFLKENPSETIIFQFKNDNNKENVKCFNNLFYHYIKGNESKWYLKSVVPTLDEARGKIVLVRRCSMALDNPEFTANNTGIDFSHWVEQDELVPNALTLKTYAFDKASFLILDRFKYRPEPRWTDCIKPFLDARKEFDGEYVICYLSTAGGKKGPYSNALFINNEFLNYKLDSKKYYGLIFLDFPTEELTKKIINSNLGE